MSLISLSSRDAAWRKVLLQRLRTRDEKETNFEQYEEAISQVREKSYSEVGVDFSLFGHTQTQLLVDASELKLHKCA